MGAGADQNRLILHEVYVADRVLLFKLTVYLLLVEIPKHDLFGILAYRCKEAQAHFSI